MRSVLPLAVVVFVGCQPAARRVVRGSSAPVVPVCSVTMPAPRVTDVTCTGNLSRDVLWRAALIKAAETGPDHGSFSFDVPETNEAGGWRALRARFMTAQDPAGSYTIDALLSPAQLEAARVRATTRACQRAVIIEGSDPATKASCLQFLTAQQQIAQSERHHAEQVTVSKQSVEVQRQHVQAQQQAADALMLRSLQRDRTILVASGASNCRSSLDCGSMEFCKPWMGGSVCMGNGGPGAPCSSAIDRAGGQFCRSGYCAR
jgi:hypothetical protein